MANLRHKKSFSLADPPLATLRPKIFREKDRIYAKLSAATSLKENFGDHYSNMAIIVKKKIERKILMFLGRSGWDY